jgi:hypothetical protein
LGSLLERCEVELARVDGGREIEHGGSDQAKQSVGEAERGPSGDEQNNTRRLRAVGASCEFPSGFSVIPGQRHVDPKAWQLMTLEVSADAPANVALRVGSGVARRVPISMFSSSSPSRPAAS